MLIHVKERECVTQPFTSVRYNVSVILICVVFSGGILSFSLHTQKFQIKTDLHYIIPIELVQRNRNQDCTYN